MAEETKTAALIVTRVQNGFTVLSPRGQTYCCTVKNLHQVVEEILNDPELPEFETERAHVMALEHMVGALAISALPDAIRFVAGPAVKTLKRAVDKITVDRPPKIDRHHKEGFPRAKSVKPKKTRLSSLRLGRTA